MLSGGGNPEPLPTYLEGWDPLTDVLIERRILCDVGALRVATGLPEPLPLVVSVSWMNQQSYMTEGLYCEPLSTEQVIRVTLPSARLGGSVQLITSISVATGDQARPLGTARWAGSVLARDEQSLVLEGDGPMFPIAAVDFAATKYSAGASWALQLPEDLTLPVLGSVLLLVNTRDKELSAALAAARPEPRESALFGELETSIGAQLIAEAVSRRGELESEDWHDQSVGSLLVQYLTLADEQRVPEAVATGDSAMVNAALTGAARSGGFGRRLV
jgi:hypothetical protein